MDNQFKSVHGHHSRDHEHKVPDLSVPKKPVHTPIVMPEETLAPEHSTLEEPEIESIAEPELESNEALEPQPKTKRKFWPPNKYVVIISAVIVLLAIGGLSYLHFGHHKTVKHVVVSTVLAAPVPTTVASSLTGLQVSPATNKLPVTAVMIENSTDARPQSGLGEAGDVFEALAEGGITRFVALYQGNDSTSIGPVRSARPYFISWMLGFDADYAHVGGSPEALSDISALGVKDMDEFYNADSYQRISTRAAPHNVYTTLAALWQLEQTKNFTTSSFISWPRKSSSPLLKPTATSISLNLSSSDYNVSYTYDASTNSYNRDDGGTPEIDFDTNKQVSPNVVIAMVVQESNGPLDGIGAYYSDYQTVGSGSAYIFQNGGSIEGQWSKSANNSNIQFTTSGGQTIPLNPGQIWVTAVTTNSAVTYN